MECFQTYDIRSQQLEDYSIYLPTKSLSAGFPFTKVHFNDSSGFVLGVDMHSDLPIYFDPFIKSQSRVGHNIAVIGSTGAGKSFLMKKMVVNEIARGTKIFILDAENEYEKLAKELDGAYRDLYYKKGGRIYPLQLRYIDGTDKDSINNSLEETDCPLAKHLGFLETFFKTSFENISEKELVMLLSVVEALYNKKGIYKNTSINTLQSLKPTDYPIFSDLYNYLPEYKKKLNSKEKEKIIEQLEVLLSRFLTGTDAFLFNDYTNVDLSNDLVVFDLQKLLFSENQRIIDTQILNLITFLNNSIVVNKIEHEKGTLQDGENCITMIVDEFHLYVDKKDIMNNFGQLARRTRKYHSNMIIGTQSIQDFVGNASVLRHATAIFNNCQYTSFNRNSKKIFIKCTKRSISIISR